MTTVELKQEHAGVVAQMRELHDKTETGDTTRSFTATEQESYSKLKAKQEELINEIRKTSLDFMEELLERRDVRLAGDVTDPVARSTGLVFRGKDGKEIRGLLPGESMRSLVPPTGERQPELGRFIRGVVTGEWGPGDDIEKRTATEGVGADGGYFVSPALSARVIDLARNQSALIRAGAITIPMKTSELTLVKTTEDPVGYYRDELESITLSDGAYEPVNLKAQTLGARVLVSEELMQDAPNFGSVLENQLAQTLALKMDLSGITGTGAGEPLGLLNTDGLQDIVGGTLTNYDEFINLLADIEEANGAPTRVVYSPAVKEKLALLLDGQGLQLVRPHELEPVKILVSTQCPATDALMGGFDNVILGMRAQVKVEFSRATTAAFSQYGVEVRATLRHDWATTRPALLGKVSAIV
jgi:HK97 family phage major capsid protein